MGELNNIAGHSSRGCKSSGSRPSQRSLAGRVKCWWRVWGWIEELKECRRFRIFCIRQWGDTKSQWIEFWGEDEEATEGKGFMTWEQMARTTDSNSGHSWPSKMCLCLLLQASSCVTPPCKIQLSSHMELFIVSQTCLSLSHLYFPTQLPMQRTFYKLARPSPHTLLNPTQCCYHSSFPGAFLLIFQHGSKQTTFWKQLLLARPTCRMGYSLPYAPTVDFH